MALARSSGCSQCVQHVRRTGYCCPRLIEFSDDMILLLTKTHVQWRSCLISKESHETNQNR